MTDKVQKIKQEIERRYNCEKCYPLDREANVAAAILQELLLFIDSLPEESASEDLEEACDNYYDETWDEHGGIAMVVNNCHDIWFPSQATSDFFKAGAEWQKQQMKEALQTEYEKGRFDMREEMMKDTVEAFVNTYENSDGSNYVEFVTEQSPHKFKETEKCKIIIVKEEQQ